MTTTTSGTSGGTITGTSKNDMISSSADGQTIDSGAGNDTIKASGNDDYIDSGTGNDTVISSGHRNRIFTGDGNDTIQTSGNDDYIDSGTGNDTVIASGDRNRIITGDGNDTVTTSGNMNEIFAKGGNDTIKSSGSNDIINAGAGNDTITVSGQGTQVNAGSGNNTINARNNDIKIMGTDGKDTVNLTGNNGLVEAGSGGSTVSVNGLGNKVLYNADLNEGNWSQYSANASGNNTVIISLEKPLSASLLNQIKNDFNLAYTQNKMLDLSKYKGVLVPDASNPNGAMMLKVQGFKNLEFNLNPVAVDDLGVALFNTQYAQLSKPLTQNVLANDKDPDSPNDNSGLKINTVLNVTSDAPAGKIQIIHSETWNAQAGEVDAYLIKVGSKTATLVIKSDGSVILNGNGAFDNLQADIGQPNLHLNITYQNSDQKGGHDVAVDKITITNTLPTVADTLDLTESKAHSLALGPDGKDSIDLSDLAHKNGLTGNITYTVIGNVGAVDATGHLNINSQDLFKANPTSLDSSVAIKILATDVNGVSKVLGVDYGYHLTPSVSKEVENNSLALGPDSKALIDLSTISGLTGTVTYKIVQGPGMIDPNTGNLVVSSQTLFQADRNLSGDETFKILATDAHGIAKLIEIDYDYHFVPYDSKDLLNNTVNLGPTTETSINLSEVSGLAAATYEIIQGPGTLDNGQLVISSQDLYNPNSTSLSGVHTFQILATANGVSNLIEFDYGYNFTPSAYKAILNSHLPLGEGSNGLISLSEFTADLGANVTYKVLGDVGSVNANGQFVVSSQALYDANPTQLSGTEPFQILATAANGVSTLIGVEYDYKLQPSVTSSYKITLDKDVNTNVNIDLDNVGLNFSDLSGNPSGWTYQLVVDGVVKGEPLTDRTVHETSNHLYNLAGQGKEDLYIMATDSDGTSQLGKVDIQIKEPIDDFFREYKVYSQATTIKLSLEELVSYSQGDIIKVTDTNDLIGNVISVDGNLVINPARLFGFMVGGRDTDNPLNYGDNIKIFNVSNGVEADINYFFLHPNSPIPYPDNNPNIIFSVIRTDLEDESLPTLTIDQSLNGVGLKIVSSTTTVSTNLSPSDSQVVFFPTKTGSETGLAPINISLPSKENFSVETLIEFKEIKSINVSGNPDPAAHRASSYDLLGFASQPSE